MFIGFYCLGRTSVPFPLFVGFYMPLRCHFLVADPVTCIYYFNNFSSLVADPKQTSCTPTNAAVGWIHCLLRSLTVHEVFWGSPLCPGRQQVGGIVSNSPSRCLYCWRFDGCSRPSCRPNVGLGFSSLLWIRSTQHDDDSRSQHRWDDGRLAGDHRHQDAHSDTVSLPALESAYQTAQLLQEQRKEVTTSTVLQLG